MVDIRTVLLISREPADYSGFCIDPASVNFVAVQYRRRVAAAAPQLASFTRLVGHLEQ